MCELPDCKYLEVGVYQGAMFASALQGNNIIANAVDNWSDTHNVPMRDIDIKAEKEDTKQVVVHFSGFRTVNEADLFSVYLVEELDLHHLQAPKTVTLH